MQESIAINVAHKVEAPRVSGLIAAEEVIDHQSWMNGFTHMLATGERKRWWAGIEDMDASGARQVMMNLIHHFTKCPRVCPELRFARHSVRLRLIEPKLDRCKRFWNDLGDGVLGYAIADADSKDHVALPPLDIRR